MPNSYFFIMIHKHYRSSVVPLMLQMYIPLIITSAVIRTRFLYVHTVTFLLCVIFLCIQIYHILSGFFHLIQIQKLLRESCWACSIEGVQYVYHVKKRVLNLWHVRVGVVNIKMMTLWDFAPCSVVERWRNLLPPSSWLKEMEAVDSSDRMVRIL
jgi:hypothetical protein